jgi:tetratricopeptide (TPR) repeat protein
MRTSTLLTLLFAIGASLPAQAQQRTPTANAQGNMAVYAQALKFGDINTAIVALHYEMQANPSNTSLLDSLASLYFASGSYPQAIVVAKKVLETQPNNQKMLELVAIGYQTLGMAREALENYEKLYAKSREVFHLYQVSVLQYQMQRFGECAQSLQALVNDQRSREEKIVINVNQQMRQEVPIAAAALNVLGVLAMEQRENDRARQFFQQSLQVFPDFALAKGNLQQLDSPQPGQPNPGQPQPQQPSPTPGSGGRR